MHRVVTSATYIGKVAYKGVIYDGEHEAIVDAESFTRAREVLADNSADRGASTRNRRGYLLRSLLRCTVCGSAMTTTWAKNERYRYYTCTKVNKSGRNACSVRSVAADVIESGVIAQLRAIAGEPELIGQITRHLSQGHAEKLPALKNERDRLREEYHRCRDQAAGAIRALGDENDASRLAADHLAELDQRATEIEQRQSAIQEEMAAIARKKVCVTDVQRALSLFDPVWDLLGATEQARILRLLLERVHYDGMANAVEFGFRDVGIASLSREVASVEGEADEVES